jgi:hypothetical protein
MSDEKYKELMAKLEKEGEQKVKELNLLLSEKELLAIMQKGADTFQKETGRPMTYGEMREMYG